MTEVALRCRKFFLKYGAFFLLLAGAFIFLSATSAPLPEGVNEMPSQQEITLPSYGGAFLKMILTLIGLLVAVFFTVFLLKKLSRGRAGHSDDSIKILEKRALSGKTMLYLIEIGDKQTLIAESQLEIKTIASLDVLPEEEI